MKTGSIFGGYREGARLGHDESYAHFVTVSVF